MMHMVGGGGKTCGTTQGDKEGMIGKEGYAEGPSSTPTRSTFILLHTGDFSPRQHGPVLGSRWRPQPHLVGAPIDDLTPCPPIRLRGHQLPSSHAGSAPLSPNLSSERTMRTTREPRAMLWGGRCKAPGYTNTPHHVHHVSPNCA